MLFYMKQVNFYSGYKLDCIGWDNDLIFKFSSFAWLTWKLEIVLEARLLIPN